MGLTLLVFAAYGLFAATVRRHVVGRPRVVTWMRRTFAASYAVLAGRLALVDCSKETLRLERAESCSETAASGRRNLLSVTSSAMAPATCESG